MGEPLVEVQVTAEPVVILPSGLVIADPHDLALLADLQMAAVPLDAPAGADDLARYRSALRRVFSERDGLRRQIAVRDAEIARLRDQNKNLSEEVAAFRALTNDTGVAAALSRLEAKLEAALGTIEDQDTTIGGLLRKLAAAEEELAMVRLKLGAAEHQKRLVERARLEDIERPRPRSIAGMTLVATLRKRLPKGLVSKQTVHNWCISGEIGAVQIGNSGRWYVFDDRLYTRVERLAEEKGKSFIRPE
jgi:hypothetical protein